MKCCVSRMSGRDEERFFRPSPEMVGSKNPVLAEFKYNHVSITSHDSCGMMVSFCILKAIFERRVHVRTLWAVILHQHIAFKKSTLTNDLHGTVPHPRLFPGQYPLA